MTKIWHNRIQNELLQLQKNEKEKESTGTGAGAGAALLLPKCVVIQDQVLSLERGECLLNVSVTVSGANTVPVVHSQQENQIQKSIVKKEDNNGNGNVTVFLKIDASENRTNFPFLPPKIYLLSLKDENGKDVALPSNSTVACPTINNENSLSEQNLLDFDLDWTPNLTLGHVIQHLALKLRESILQNEPILADTNISRMEDFATGADVYQSEVSELTENYKVGKQKLTEYFTKFTKQIDTFLEENDESASATSNSYNASNLCDVYYEAEIIDQNVAKAESKKGFGSMTSWAANLLAPKKMLALTADGNHLLYVMENGNILEKYDLDKLQKLKFRR